MPEYDEQAGVTPDGGAPASLTDGVSALLEDGRTYLEAEIAFQRSRAIFTATESKRGLYTLLATFAFLHAALIALVVGGLLALVPVLGGLGAMLAITLGLVAAALITGLVTKRRFTRVSRLYRDDGHE